MDTPLAAYLPQDRRAALAHGEELPQDAYGAALFADINGFTPLTEALNRTLGARRGSVIGFAGDSLTCWFDGAGLEA